jgi:hypothetical protein
VSNVDDRLAGLDPAAQQPYRHADLDAMITRIVATPALARSTRWQRIQVRFAGGLIAATLATALTLVATQGAPSLSALAIQRALTAPSESFATALPMKATEDVRVSAGPGISSRAPSIASHRLAPPAHARFESARLAAVFGVVGTPRARADENWTVTSASGAVLNYDDLGVPQWYYSSTSPKVAPAEESGSVAVAMPSHAVVESDVHHYLSELDVNYSLGSPSFSNATTSTTTTNGAPLTVYSETASYSVLVDGTATGQSLSFTVDPTNSLLYAEGPAFRVEPGVDYPLLSPRAGVKALEASEGHLSGASASAPVTTALVSGEKVSFAAYRLKNGTLWLLPIYTFSGSITPAQGSAAARTWSQLAIDPTYLAGSSATAEGVSN